MLSLNMYRLNLRWALLGLLTDGWLKRSPLPKIFDTYPTTMKPGSIIPYLKNIQGIY